MSLAFNLLLISQFSVFNFLLRSRFLVYNTLLGFQFWVFNLLLRSQFSVFNLILRSQFLTFNLLLRSQLSVFSWEGEVPAKSSPMLKLIFDTRRVLERPYLSPEALVSINNFINCSYWAWISTTFYIYRLFFIPCLENLDSFSAFCKFTLSNKVIYVTFCYWIYSFKKLCECWLFFILSNF